VPGPGGRARPGQDTGSTRAVTLEAAAAAAAQAPGGTPPESDQAPAAVTVRVELASDSESRRGDS
jgi:hypothetical protein